MSDNPKELAAELRCALVRLKIDNDDTEGVNWEDEIKSIERAAAFLEAIYETKLKQELPFGPALYYTSKD